MLNKANTLRHWVLDGLDGEIGNVRDFYFDERHWVIRYLVADTGNWLENRQVLISPYALDAVSEDERCIAIGLTQKQIEDSPPLHCDMPVSRQFEQAYYDYFGWPAYWDGPHLWGPYPILVRDRAKWQQATHSANTAELQLRRTTDMGACQFNGGRGEIGHFEDFIIDDETWAIRYLIIDTHNWWPGKRVLVAPQWIEHIDWDELNVLVNLPNEMPEYDGSRHTPCDYAMKLHPHEAHECYWDRKHAFGGMAEA